MPGHESEAETRKKRIDPRLRSDGWIIVSFEDSMKTGELQP